MVNVSLFPHVDLLCNEGNEIWIAADTERERDCNGNTGHSTPFSVLPISYIMLLTNSGVFVYTLHSVLLSRRVIRMRR